METKVLPYSPYFKFLWSENPMYLIEFFFDKYKCPKILNVQISADTLDDFDGGTVSYKVLFHLNPQLAGQMQRDLEEHLLS